jgi:EmrB/QacA subfamily drug resistance transporter
MACPPRCRSTNNSRGFMVKESNLKWWVLATVIIGTFLGRLDQTIVNLALPKIIQDFSIGVSTAGWIATAYIIANAVFVAVWGKLGDMTGRKRIYLLGFTIFIIGSILAGLSWNFSSLIVFRVVQAIASSADYPTAMAIIAVTFAKGRDRAQALGIWSASFAAAIVFGPLIGGPLIDWFGWRSVFLVNIPIGIIGIFMALAFIKESKSDRRVFEFDWSGAVYLGIMLSALVLVLDKATDWGWWGNYSIIAYLIIITFSLLFYFTEKKHKEPIVDFKFFKNPAFVGTLVNNFIVFMGMSGGVFLIPVFVQTFMGYSATQTGYLFIPMAFFMLLSAQIGGRLVGRVKSSHVIFASTLVAFIGMLLFGFFIDARSTALDIIIPLSIFAMGMGFAMAQRTNIIASSVPEHEIGIASSVLALVRNISGAFGIAIFATILNSSIENNVISLSKNTVINSISPLVHAQVTALVMLKAQILGYVTVFNIAAVFILLGAIAALFIRVPHEVIKKVHVE